MISLAAGLIRDELSRFIVNNKRNDDQIVAGDILLANIAELENTEFLDLRNKVVITVVNIEEESTLKNRPNYIPNASGTGKAYNQPPVSVNLYVLFSATLGDTVNAYEFALHRVSLVIEFFQSKRLFTVQNSPQSVVGQDPAFTPLEREILRLAPELYTLTFEQINHLWGALGGKQVPSVMYKIRLVEIASRESRPAPAIEEINQESRNRITPPETLPSTEE